MVYKTVMQTSYQIALFLGVVLCLFIKLFSKKSIRDYGACSMLVWLIFSFHMIKKYIAPQLKTVIDFLAMFGIFLIPIFVCMAINIMVKKFNKI